MFVYGIKPGSSEEEEEEDVMDILQVRWKSDKKQIWLL